MPTNFDFERNIRRWILAFLDTGTGLLILFNNMILPKTWLRGWKKYSIQGVHATKGDEIFGQDPPTKT